MKNKHRKFDKAPLVLSLVFFLLSIYVFVYLYNRLQNNNAIFEKAQAEWQTESSRKDSMEALYRSLRNTADGRAMLDKHFIQSSDVVPFLDTIERLAPDVGAKAEVTQLEISKDGKTLLVGAKASGSFASLYKFITLLENSPYQIDFATLDLKKDAASAWTATFSVRLLTFLK